MSPLVVVGYCLDPIMVARPASSPQLNDLVVVRATGDSGVAGWDEVREVLAVLGSYLFPRTVGRGVHEGATAVYGQVRDNPFAKCALDIALTDLRARVLDVPVAALWGEHAAAPVPLSWSLAATSLREDVEEATAKRELGYGIFKVKVAALPLRRDLERVTAVRDALGPAVSVRVDANQGWTRADAGTAVKELADLGVDFVEQPLPRADTVGLAALQRASSVPIAADESLRTVADATRLAATDAARVFVYKLAKHGGFATARNVAAVAGAHGAAGYLGCMIESSIGTAAYLGFAASGVSLELGCELFGPQLLVDDLTKEPVAYSAGHVHPPVGPGLGVEVDEAKVAAMAAAHVRAGR